VRVTDSRVQPTPFDINILFLTVYAQRNGRWQQIAWQSTRDVATSFIECRANHGTQDLDSLGRAAPASKSYSVNPNWRFWLAESRAPQRR
jgi:hypothetical protein